MTEWIYPVNERRPESWGYSVSAVDFFSGKRESGPHGWYLSRRLRNFHVGDLLWVRASAPLKAFVGLGMVASEPEWEHDAFRFLVAWDARISKLLADQPVQGVLEKHTRSVRGATALESRRLRQGVGGPSQQPPVRGGKIRRSQEVVQRQGQADLRARLLLAYQGRCAITGTDIPPALQAAHIEPYDGSASNVVTNGLLLRADVHNVFDLGLLWITSGSRVAVGTDLESSEYGRLQGRKLRLPIARERPSREALKRHRIEIALQTR